jgi:formylglycine-generating enzyme required for sulfatase activity
LICRRALTMSLVLCFVATAHARAPTFKPASKQNPRDGLIYILAPAGSFRIGCSADDNLCFSEEKPAHQVTISTAFWIGQTEVTVAAYERFAGISDPSKAASSMPIVDVTWDEASNYCQWAGGRLPTEAEWEYAARGGSSESRYASIDDIAWYQNNSGDTSHQVSKKLPNAFGIFDVLGNVWEWVNDWFDASYYANSPARDPSGPATGRMRVLRGGSALNAAKLVRLSDRGRAAPDVRFNYFGFRCVWLPRSPK